MTSTSKIARLPKSLRDQLGLRLEDGLPGKEIVQWLNVQPETRQIVDKYFDGSLVTEQNLSDWRHSGHPQWLRRQETRQAALHLAESAADLADPATGHNLADRFGSILTAEFNHLLAELAQKDSTPEKRWQRLCQLNRELALLRHHDHQAARLALEQERWQHQLHQEAKAEQAHQQAAQKQELIDLVRSAGQKQLDATLLGGGDHGQKLAELIHRLRHASTPQSALRTPHSNGQPLDNQAPSSPIVPDKADALIHPSINPTIPQSINPTIHPSINPTIHQSINPTIHQSINPTIPQSSNPPIHRPGRRNFFSVKSSSI
jgi:hypothetical protein